MVLHEERALGSQGWNKRQLYDTDSPGESVSCSLQLHDTDSPTVSATSVSSLPVSNYVYQYLWKYINEYVKSTKSSMTWFSNDVFAFKVLNWMTSYVYVSIIKCEWNVSQQGFTPPPF